MKQIVIYKGRTAILPVSFGDDISNDTFTSEIRVDKDPASLLITTWDVSFDTNGVDGELILTLDDSITGAVTKSVGYMDIKRITDGEPINVFNQPVEVLFKNPVTV